MKERKGTNHYKVVAMCGHVGKRKYVPIAFAVKAPSASEAAKATRLFPRVKHHRKEAILSVEEITPEEYRTLREINENDPYLKARTPEDIDCIDGFEERVISYDDGRIWKKNSEKPLNEKYRKFKRLWATNWGMKEFYDDEECVYQ